VAVFLQQKTLDTWQMIFKFAKNALVGSIVDLAANQVFTMSAKNVGIHL